MAQASFVAPTFVFIALLGNCSQGIRAVVAIYPLAIDSLMEYRLQPHTGWVKFNVIV